MKSFNAKRDQAVADAAVADQRLMCAAHGCPNRWSLASTRTCRWHTAAHPSMWPQVTQSLLDDIADAARRDPGPPSEPTYRMSLAEKRGILARAQAALVPKHPRAWIGLLEARARKGERLSAAQRNALAAVRGTAVLDRACDGDDIGTEEISDALRATGDLADDSWAHVMQEIA